MHSLGHGRPCFLCILDQNASSPPLRGPYWMWLLRTSALQRGVGEMLHIGCECWDGASVSLKCLCTVFPLLSSLPLVPPPPINDPFVRVFFAAVGWQASAGPNPKTAGLSWNFFFPFSQSIICTLQPTFFSSFTLYSLDCSSSSLLYTACPCPSSCLMDFWNSFPPLSSLHTLLFNKFFFFPEDVSLPLLSLCFSPSFKGEQSWDVVLLLQQCEKETEK